jgi:hypothetical protein
MEARLQRKSARFLPLGCRRYPLRDSPVRASLVICLFETADVAQARRRHAAAASVVQISCAVADEEPQYLSAPVPAGAPLSFHPAQMRDHNAAELPVLDGDAVLVDNFDENVALRDVEVDRI